MTLAFVIAATHALCLLAGYLIHRVRTRRIVGQLADHIDVLMADLAAIPADQVEHRQAVLVDHERRRHRQVSVIDAYFLSGNAA